jgi:5'-3' exonuclease
MVMISNSSVPGESDFKIFEFIRKQQSKSVC